MRATREREKGNEVRKGQNHSFYQCSDCHSQCPSLMKRFLEGFQGRGLRRGTCLLHPESAFFSVAAGIQQPGNFRSGVVDASTIEVAYREGNVLSFFSQPSNSKGFLRPYQTVPKFLKKIPPTQKVKTTFQRSCLPSFVFQNKTCAVLLCRVTSQGNRPSGTEGVSRSQSFVGENLAE